MAGIPIYGEDLMVVMLYTDETISPANRAAAETALQQYMDGHKGKGKDWLNSVTIGISYAFGRPPCYCK